MTLGYVQPSPLYDGWGFFRLDLVLVASRKVTISSDDSFPSSSPVKTSDNFEKFTDELAPLNSLPPGNDDSTLKKEFHEVNFQVYSNPLLEFDESFKSSNVLVMSKITENSQVKPGKNGHCGGELGIEVIKKAKISSRMDDKPEISCFKLPQQIISPNS
ncbi:hypothetical protein Tco_1136166 [Tanacetum coccineum]